MSLENFHLVTKLQGHHGNINCLSFSSDGCLLSSGGDDESVRIWDVEKHTCRQILCDPAHRWGQITTVQWVTHKASGDTLYFGTGRGMVLLYQSKKPGTPFKETFSKLVFEEISVEAIAHDPVNRKLVVTSHGGDIHMWDLTKISEWKRVWKIKTNEPSILRGVYFLDHYQTVVVFKLETGEAIYLDVESAKSKRTTQIKSSIGHVSQYNGNVILVDNLRDGFDLYDLERPYPMRSFSIPTSRYFVRQGVFAEFFKFAVCGSDHGKVYIFDVRTSALVETLQHGEANTFVHAIESFHDRNRGLTLIASGPLEQEKPEIHLWVRNTIMNNKQDRIEEQSREAKHFSTLSFSSRLQMVLNIGAILMVLWMVWDTGKLGKGHQWISARLQSISGQTDTQLACKVHTAE